MANNQRNKSKLRTPMYPVGGFTKRIDQYGAVPASVLAEERRLQQLESRIEKGRIWQLAQCEKKQREAARHLQELNEAKEKVWMPPVEHREYLYGGCVTVRMMAKDTAKTSTDDGGKYTESKDTVVVNDHRRRRKEHDIHRRPPGTACHRTQAGNRLPNLLVKPTLHTRRPRSWATLKNQFQEKVLPGGEFPRVHRGNPCRQAATGSPDQDGAMCNNDVAGTGRSSYRRGDDFVSEMKHCHYLRVPAWYGGHGDDNDEDESDMNEPVVK